MLRGRPIFAAVFAVLAAVAGVSSAGAARPLQTAVAEHFEFDLAPSDTQLALKRIHDAGATAFRITLPWYRVAPTTLPAGFDPSNPNDPNYHWESFDRALSLLKTYSLEPIVVVNAPPLWARDPTESGLNPPPTADQLRAFAHAAAERYSGRTPGIPRVRYWQFWIEPNVNVFFSPQYEGKTPVSPVIYRRLLNVFTSTVHAVASDNVVIAGGLSPFTVSAGTTRTVGPLTFMRSMLCMSASLPPHPTCNQRAEFDIWSHHPFTSGGPTHHAYKPQDVSLGDLPEMKQLLVAAYRAHHVVSHGMPRFWVTEFSWDTNPPDPAALPVGLQARWTAEALYQMWKVGITLVTWLDLRDHPYPQDAVQSGLYYRGATLKQDRPKPTLAVFRFPMVAYARKKGIFVWGRTPWGRPGRVAIDERLGGGGAWRRLGMVKTDRYGIFSTTLRGDRRPKDFVRGTVIGAGLSGPSARTLKFSLKRPPDRFLPSPFGSGG
jgi:hypothetical protein